MDRNRKAITQTPQLRAEDAVLRIFGERQFELTKEKEAEEETKEKAARNHVQFSEEIITSQSEGKGVHACMVLCPFLFFSFFLCFAASTFAFVCTAQRNALLAILRALDF